MAETNNKDPTHKSDENENKIPNKNMERDMLFNEINPELNINKSKKCANDRNVNIFLLICIIGVSLGILLEIINVQNRNQSYKDYVEKTRKYWVYSNNKDVDNKNGILKHVHIVLQRIGYEKTTNETPWNLLWSHDFPFRVLYPNMHRLKSYQKVNHFPGTAFITNKVDLATSNYKYIPRAFKLPKNKVEFLKYASENKDALFLEKHNQHRGVYLKNVSEIDLLSGESFVQEYVQKPFLVDGYKFDIGVYVVLTSVNPLRAYWYKGDVLFRYCPVKYYPFDPKNLDKYVIGDDYLPTWEVPSLVHPYTTLGFGMKESFDTYARSKGKNTTKMWDEVQKAIAEVLVKKEHHLIEAGPDYLKPRMFKETLNVRLIASLRAGVCTLSYNKVALKHYPSSDNFFEMMRFDLIVDEDLKVYVLEANMSPNLSSAHYLPNQLIYEQVLYNLFSITGVSNQAHGLNDERNDTAAKAMISSHKNIAVWADKCRTSCRDSCESLEICGVCKHCLTAKLKNAFLRAHQEYLHRGDFRRLFPPSMVPHSLAVDELQNLTTYNKLQYLWYQGKCNQDITWCT